MTEFEIVCQTSQPCACKAQFWYLNLVYVKLLGVFLLSITLSTEPFMRYSFIHLDRDKHCKINALPWSTNAVTPMRAWMWTCWVLFYLIWHLGLINGNITKLRVITVPADASSCLIHVSPFPTPISMPTQHKNSIRQTRAIVRVFALWPCRLGFKFRACVYVRFHQVTSLFIWSEKKPRPWISFVVTVTNILVCVMQHSTSSYS